MAAPRKPGDTPAAEDTTPTAKRAPAKRKPPAKRKAPAKRTKRGPTRSRFEPATPEDFAAVDAALAKSAAEQEKAERLTPEARVARDDAVLSAIAIGLTPAEAGRRAGITRYAVKRIVDADRERRRAEMPSGTSVLWDALAGLDANIAAMAALQEATAPTADDERKVGHLYIGATRTKDAMQLSRLELLVSMGVVSVRPSDDERAEQARAFAAKLVRELREAGVEEAVLEEATRQALGVQTGTVSVLKAATDSRRQA